MVCDRVHLAIQKAMQEMEQDEMINITLMRVNQQLPKIYRINTNSLGMLIKKYKRTSNSHSCDCPHVQQTISD